MDLVLGTTEITKETIEGVSVLDPGSIFVMSITGLIVTLVFIFIFRNRLLESYGKRVYLWFIFLVCLNILNIIFMSWYYNKKNSNPPQGIIGPPGEPGDLGKKGEDIVPGLCGDTQEIGIQYSNNYFLVGKINKTTNVLGQIGIWRASGMLGLSSLGDTVFTQTTANKSRTYMAGYGSKPPTDFKNLIEITDGISKITLWEPIPPKGYSYLGHFAMIGQKKPELENVACLPTGCLVKTDSSNLLYLASFPAIDIIPTNSANRNLKFCSFWKTPLNHFYCKVSDGNYTTNSVYYNLVEGSPEYYDSKKQEPIQEKYDEIMSILKDKQSVIYHAPKAKEKEFNTIFIENIRNDTGKVIETKIYGSMFNKLLNNTTLFSKYLVFFRNAINYVYKLKEENPKKITFVKDEKSTNPKNAFNGFVKHINQAYEASPQDIDTIKKFVNAFEKNPQTAMKIFQDPTNSFGITSTIYPDMTLKERKSNFEILINNLGIKEIKVVLGKLSSNIPDDTQDETKLFDVLNSKKKNEIKNAYANEEEVNPSLTLQDDLFYLFSRGLDDQIAETEEDAIEGGYYLGDVENRQRKNFIDYIKTFIKPNIPIYSFRKKCMIFVDSDLDRIEIINRLTQIYDLVSQKLENLDNCDNDEYLTKYYTNMMRKIDNQFKSVEGYNDKIKNREFSYFPTSRLKWLLNEMQNYYNKINVNCVSDDRTKYISQIKVYRDQLMSDFRTTIDFNLYDLKYKDNKLNVIDINTKVANSDFDVFKTEQLKKILRIITDFYNAKMKESTDAVKNIKK